MNLEEYAGHDATGLAGLIRTGQVTSSELAELALAAIEKVNPAINAVIDTYPDRANQNHADTLPDGPFRGVPMLAKDLGSGERGCLEEMGSPLAKGLRHEHDSEVFARFRAAGFVNLGRTTTAEFGMLGVTENKLTGNTRNPWSVGRTPGGSSGGSAAIVAAGAVPLASGGDAGGSIRVPAGYCGLVGLKPSRGRISMGAGRSDGFISLAVPFALTRSIRDTANLLDCLAAPHPADIFRAPLPDRPFSAHLETPSRPHKIALCANAWYGFGVEDSARDAVNKTARFLRDEGHHVAEASPRFNYQEYVDAALAIWSANLHAGLNKLAARAGRKVRADDLLGSSFLLYEYGGSVLATDYVDAMAVFQKVVHEIGKLFDHYDFFLLPTTPVAAPPIGYVDINPQSDADIVEWHNSIYANDYFNGVFNVSGNPAISLPVHMDDKGIPVGVQLVARFGDEAGLLNLAGRIEKAFPWRDRTPGIHASNVADDNGS